MYILSKTKTKLYLCVTNNGGGIESDIILVFKQAPGFFVDAPLAPLVLLVQLVVNL